MKPRQLGSSRPSELVSLNNLYLLLKQCQFRQRKGQLDQDPGAGR